MRIHKTISLTDREFQWALEQMRVNDWSRSGDTEGISRYVQELIRKDMPQGWQPQSAQPSASPKRTQRLATRKRS